MKLLLFICLLSGCCLLASRAEESRHIGDFILGSHFKLTGGKITPIPIKPIKFRVYSDGIHVRVSAEGEEEASTVFEIYRSDGIARQRPGRGALEVVPGLQGINRNGGIVRHLRLTKDFLTMTTFPGVSDQTLVTHCKALEPATPAEKTAP
ncbi:MAG: hypothetical protein V4733_09905 [Verrucomicrobiota bacterium]